MTILRIAGVPIQVHWTLAAMLVALALALGVTLGPGDALRATALVLAILASVVAHELGHVLAAARLGVRTRSILLMPLGGVARLDARWVTPRADATIAVAGPLTSLAIGAALLTLGRAWPDVTRLGELNVGIGLLNLAPIYPMDGGRVLRAALIERVGPARGTRIALTIGLVLIAAVAAAGAWALQPGVLVLCLYLLAGQRREAAAA